MKNMFFKIYGLMVLLISSVSLYGSNVVAEIEYFYADDGTLIGKAFNGKRVNFEYDLRGQLLAVTDASGNDLERYTYDPAGNRLSKTINGVTTTYSYDEANQLIRSTVNGEITYYEYDAAGRMIQAGDKSYIYNGNNKVIEVRQNGETIAKFEYNIDGQIAKAIYGDKKEEFVWDGLALIWRSGVTYINEPYVTGGNPVMAGDDVLFNDMLGSTLAVNDKVVEMTSFGETDNENAFFTGKPMIDELGYSFLFRDYNPNQGKWTTSDPLGYPDGWNNLAYCNNQTISFVDVIGGWKTSAHDEFFKYSIFYEGRRMKEKYLNLIISSDKAVDEDQSVVNSYKHAMKTISQTVEEANLLIDSNIEGHIVNALDTALSYINSESTSLDLLDVVNAAEIIVTELGAASHSYQDKTCPVHYDSKNNTPETWFGTWFLDWVHFPELFLYVPEASIKEYKSWVEGVFERVLLGNDGLINEIFE